MTQLQKVESDYFSSAPTRWSRTFLIPKPAAEVWAELTGESPLNWVDNLSLRWTSPRPLGRGSTREANLFGGALQLKEYFFIWEDGHRYSFYATEANTDNLVSCAEDYRVEARGDDASAFTFTVAMTLTEEGKSQEPTYIGFFDEAEKAMVAHFDAVSTENDA